VFAIEPGIHVAGAFGLRFETTYRLGADGPEPLNRAPRWVRTAPAPSA
jgi:Xaa-Pro aminopeptidase